MKETHLKERFPMIKLKIADLFMEAKNYSEALPAYLELVQKINKDQISSNESGEMLFHIYENIGLLHYQMYKLII